MNIPLLLKNQREMLQLTQQQVADKLFVSRNAYTQYETGKRKVDTETFFKLVEILDINITVKEYLNSEIRMMELSRKHNEWKQKREEFFAAISANDAAKVAWFIDNGMDIEEKNNENIRAFTYALMENAYDVVDYLFKKGAVYYIEGENEAMPPLCLACAAEYIETVNVLLKNGTDPNETVEIDGVLSPLWIAARTKNKAIFSLLMECGADINFKTDILNNPDPDVKKNIFVDLFVSSIQRSMGAGGPISLTEEEKDMMLFIIDTYEDKLDKEILDTGIGYIKDFG